MFLCELLQAVHGGLLELHQALTSTGVLHLNLPLTFLYRDTEIREDDRERVKYIYTNSEFNTIYIY